MFFVLILSSAEKNSAEGPEKLAKEVHEKAWEGKSFVFVLFFIYVFSSAPVTKMSVPVDL